MSQNHFLNTGISSLSLQDGTFPIDIAQAIIQNLDPSRPVVTNLQKKLVSGDILISQVSGLQDELDGKISNPLTTNINMQTFLIENSESYGAIRQPSTTPAEVGELKLYANDDGKWHTVDENGIDSVVGGGDVTGPASSVDNEIPLYDSTTGKIIKNSGLKQVSDGYSGGIDITPQGTDAFVGLTMYHGAVNEHVFCYKDVAIRESFLGWNSFVAVNEDTPLIRHYIGNAYKYQADETKTTITNADIELNGAVKINNTFSLPTVDGTANQVLATDGAGVCSFVTLASSSTLQEAYTASAAPATINTTAAKPIVLQGYSGSNDDIIRFRNFSNNGISINSDGNRLTSTTADLQLVTTSGAMNLASNKIEADMNAFDWIRAASINSMRLRSELRFYDSTNASYIGFRAATSGMNNFTYTLPANNPTTLNAQFLSSTPSGVMSWLTPSLAQIYAASTPSAEIIITGNNPVTIQGQAGGSNASAVLEIKNISGVQSMFVAGDGAIDWISGTQLKANGTTKITIGTSTTTLNNTTSTLIQSNGSTKIDVSDARTYVPGRFDLGSVGGNYTFPAARGGTGTFMIDTGGGNLAYQSYSLQTAYGYSSPTAEIAIAANNPLSIKIGAGVADTTALIEMRNVAGTVVSNMTGDGFLNLFGSTSGNFGLKAAATTTTYNLTMPPAQGGAAQTLSNNGSGVLSWSALGNVVGPASVGSDSQIALFNGTTGKLLKGQNNFVYDTANRLIKFSDLSNYMGVDSSKNIWIGYLPGSGGGDNIIIGSEAGNPAMVGANNIVIGTQAGFTGVAASGSSNLFIGASADTTAVNCTNSCAIGNGAIVNGSNKIRLGNISIASVEHCGEHRMMNPADTFATGFKAPALLANCIYTLPLADGTANQVLTTNGSKVLSWSSNTPVTLQEAYNGGASPMILTDNTRNGVILRTGAGLSANPILIVQDDAFTQRASITGAGDATFLSLTAQSSLNFTTDFSISRANQQVFSSTATNSFIYNPSTGVDVFKSSAAFTTTAIRSTGGVHDVTVGDTQVAINSGGDAKLTVFPSHTSVKELSTPNGGWGDVYLDANGTTTSTSLTTTWYKIQGAFSSSVNANQFTAGADGRLTYIGTLANKIFKIDYSISYTTSAGGTPTMAMAIFQNLATTTTTSNAYVSGSRMECGTPDAPTSMSGSCVTTMTTNDFVDLAIRNTSNSNTTIVGHATIFISQLF
jgi:hypothetical protein